MVAPIIGPFTSSSTYSFPTGSRGHGQLAFKQERVWYRQKIPYDLPLSYSFKRDIGWYTSGTYGGSPNARTPSVALAWISNPSQSSSDAYNKAWAEFQDELKLNQSQWATNVVQYRQSYDSLVKHLTNLAGVFRDIRRGHFGDLYRRFKPPKGFKMKGKTAADHVLEWRFGWQPLWNDIHSAAESLGRDLSDLKVVGKGRARWTEQDTYTLSGLYAEVREDRVAEYDQRYRISADIRITNPNMLLWNGLGLTNPFLVAYELIPFSFVANYFISIEEFLHGLCPFMGIELRNSCTTHFTTVKTRIAGTLVRSSYSYPNPGPYGLEFAGTRMTRSPGPISGPQLRLRDPWILQPGRGTNAVALLLQQLAKKR